jgi:ribonuclease VapC
MDALLETLAPEIDPVTEARAGRVARAYGRWGEGVDPAGPNFGDRFAYAAAEATGLPWLHVGGDFARTDLVRATGD